MLCQTFHEALLKSPEGFSYGLLLEGFPCIQVQWAPVGQTAGVLIVPTFVPRPAQTGPDIMGFLLNGIESPADLAALAKRFPVGADVWQELLNASKPVAFNLVFTVGRLREPATITIINAFANSFFSLFGTNETSDFPTPA